jgi:hypothetical protein
VVLVKVAPSVELRGVKSINRNAFNQSGDGKSEAGANPEQDSLQERKKLLKNSGNIEPYDLDRAGI